MSPRDFESCANEHYPRLVRRLTLVLHDAEEAKDVAQETYLRAYQAWERFDGADIRAWLHTIGLRLAFNRLRSRRRWLARFGRRTSDAVWVQPERLDLWNAIGQLRPQQRAALLLNVLDGYTQAEVARMLETPPGTVANWIADGKAQLRDALREENDDSSIR